jgi:hypothetical protein
MAYRIQVFYPEAGVYMGTNHESDDAAELKDLIRSGIFAGVKIRMVDSDDNEIPIDDIPTVEKDDLTVEDIGRILGVPVVDPKEAFGDIED